MAVTPNAVDWPRLKPKKGLQVREVLPDQIYVIDDLLSKDECAAFLRLGKTLKLEAPRPPGRGEATRTNFRYENYSPDFAQAFLAILDPYMRTVPAIQSPSSPQGLFPRIRIYHYPPQTFFGPHYDDNLKDAQTGLTSRWTLLVYLTGEPDVQGGETVFQLPVKGRGKGKQRETVAVSLKAGRAVLHKHGADCLLHKGAKVDKGDKWVLRSDVMY